MSFFMSSISFKESSLGVTIREAPKSLRNATVSFPNIVIWVLACICISGKLSLINLKTPISCTITASKPFS